MAASNSNPTVRRLELAARLRSLRLAAGRSVEDAAGELMCSPAKISRMETGGRGVQPRDIRDLSRLYGVSGTVQTELMQAAADAKKPGWWQDMRTLPEQVSTFLGLETAATRILNYDPVRLFGLFQTPEYSRALLSTLRSRGEFTEEWIEETVRGRAIRRERLTSGELQVHVILDEAALRRPVGSSAIMASQIKSLIHDVALENVTLQVVPFSVGSYPGLEGSFQLLSFPSDHLDEIIFVEGMLGNFILDKSVDTARYRNVFDEISIRYGLSESASARWLEEILTDYSHGSWTVANGMESP